MESKEKVSESDYRENFQRLRKVITVLSKDKTYPLFGLYSLILFEKVIYQSQG
jgi:hypothetical protein